MKNVVLMGKGWLAAKVADYFYTNPDYALVAVVPNNPSSPVFPELETWLTEHPEILVVSSGKVRDVPEGRIDLALSITYDKIIREDFIGRCGRVLNIHNSPLPKYRGVRPVNWALKNGERQHGVTIHEIVRGIDEGPILAQRIFPIDPVRDEVKDVYRRCLEVGWELFQEVAPRLLDMPAHPQDHASATYYSSTDAALLGDRSSFTRSAT